MMYERLETEAPAMRLPRVWFTVWTVMVAAAVAGAVSGLLARIAGWYAGQGEDFRTNILPVPVFILTMCLGAVACAILGSWLVRATARPTANSRARGEAHLPQ